MGKNLLDESLVDEGSVDGEFVGADEWVELTARIRD